jgi:Domain of unknown function (DUF6457)
VHEWLAKQADALAAATETPRDALELEDADVRTLLDLAKIAAHEGGDRTNAPLLCYLLGVARGSAELHELAEIVRSTS